LAGRVVQIALENQGRGGGIITRGMGGFPDLLNELPGGDGRKPLVAILHGDVDKMAKFVDKCLCFFRLHSQAAIHIQGQAGNHQGNFFFRNDTGYFF
jgi:hypothetical protein